ncbi:hypothetical protein [Variovorax fucosicus]|uniref:hypothetical protein n=1 Tax=Variovorax fucosicus TaxID=3053517 RepID=UPI002574CF5A|nr:hypothetical protein [Variovorax sp. J22G47]MDM0055232.1 hypothetical protein [Variovorax sp. J22G47]
MIKITGLEQISKELTEAQAALKDLDGELGTVSFDPEDPSSIERAIQSVEVLIDERLGKYSKNSVIGPLADGMKESYREAILEEAAKARLNNSAEE